MDLCILLLTFTAIGFSQAEESFPCHALSTSNYTCAHCIQLHPTCAWCGHSDYNDDASTRCDIHTRLRSNGCPENQIYDPAGENRTVQDDPLTTATVTDQDVVQLKPQKVVMRLRPKERRSVVLTYRQALDYPVDLYYLMDLSLSMRDDKAKLTELGDALAKRMQKITKNFRMGFGSFVDKSVRPISEALSADDDKEQYCDDCVPTYGYHHQMKMREDPGEFQRKVSEAAISENIDRPEGGFDALMQAMVCKKEIGWRDAARRIVLFSTDADFHYAGDGRLVGLVEPNDGRCHLDQRSHYSKSAQLDYPSIAQIHETMKKSGTNVIFAVTTDQKETYQQLVNALPDVSTALGILSDDSSNIVELVAEEYNKITQKLQLIDDSPSHISIRYESKCLGETTQETNTCEGIKVSNQIDFLITVEALQCVQGKDFETHHITIGPAGLKEKLKLEIELICSCECSSKGKVSSECSGNGKKVCGVCECKPGYSGRKCECNSPESEAKLENRCRMTTDSAICQDRGQCVCGQCKCNRPKKDPINNKISGQFCECDNFNCPRHNRNTCNGEGVCECNACICNQGWSGRACECPSSTASCLSPNGKICNGKGSCECGICRCFTDGENERYSGPTCSNCLTCKSKCEEHKNCVLCKHFGTGYTNNTCESKCPWVLDQNYFIVDELNDIDKEIRTITKCQHVDPADGCTYKFAYQLDDESETATYFWIRREKECPEPVPVLAIILGVIAGVVLIGLLLLLAWKCLTILHDKREYAQFENERLKARWPTAQNPIYNNPTTTHKNPGFGRPS